MSSKREQLPGNREGGWTVVAPYLDKLCAGEPVVFTNEAPSGRAFYRGKVWLQPGGL